MARLTGGEGWSLSSDEKPKPAPAKNLGAPVPKIRLENRPGGKYVTVIAGLHTYGAQKLEGIARDMKHAFGTGGTVKNGIIEIQGDKLEEVKAWFAKAKSQPKS